MKWQKTFGMGLTLLPVGSDCAVDKDGPHDGDALKQRIFTMAR